MGLVKFTGRLLFGAYFAYLAYDMLQYPNISQYNMYMNYEKLTNNLKNELNFDLAKYVPVSMVKQNKVLLCQILSYGLLAASGGTALFVDGVPML